MNCDAHFRTWSSYSCQKSCVKIWFGLVEPLVIIGEGSVLIFAVFASKITQKRVKNHSTRYINTR